jgi:hypothetical protein
MKIHLSETEFLKAELKRLQDDMQALVAPVQEPVGDDWTPCMKLPVVVHVRQQRPGESHVSTREGITPVKPDDLIMRGVSGEEYPIGRKIFEQTYTLDTTPPAQPAQQEPIAFFDPQEKGFYWAKPMKIIAPITVAVEPMPLYTTPPAAQRQWVGLTDEQIKAIDEMALTKNMAIAITMRTLKEVNT